MKKLARFFFKILQRLITDSVKYLLRCFLESLQETEFVV